MIISRENIKEMTHSELADYVAQKLISEESCDTIDFAESYDEESEEANWIWAVGIVEFADSNYIMASYYGGGNSYFVHEYEDTKEGIEDFKKEFNKFLKRNDLTTVYIEET